MAETIAVTEAGKGGGEKEKKTKKYFMKEEMVEAIDALPLPLPQSTFSSFAHNLPKHYLTRLRYNNHQ